MSAKTPWLVAYDIRDPGRLRRVHRYMLGWGIALQYSVFAVELEPAGRAHMMTGLLGRIDPAQDDVRLYAIPSQGGAWTGAPALPDGVILTGSETVRRLF